MILTIDISNINIVLHGVQDGESVFSCRLATSKLRTADEYAALIQLISEKRGFDLCAVSGAIIASVVPQLTPVIKQAVYLLTNKNALVIGPGVKSGLNIKIDDVSELGANFVAAAVSAIARYPLPCITIDIGTATAVGVIDGKGSYIGGLICPSPVTGQTSLEKGASKLYSVSLEKPKKVICKNTTDGVQGGIIYGTAAMIDGIVERIERELGSKASVIVTGDTASIIAPCCFRDDIIVDDELIMRGLYLIYRKNRETD